MSPGRPELELDQRIIARRRLCHIMEIPTIKRSMVLVRTSLGDVCIRCPCQIAKDPMGEKKV